MSGSTYFDLSSDGWSAVKNKYNLTDQDMFELFNKPALDDAILSGKTFKFSQDPITDTKYLNQELKYLEEKGYKYMEEEMIAVYVGY